MDTHLGNVRAVVSDRRGYVSIAGDLSITNEPELVAWTDYYAYGMRMNGRSESTSVYRYSFNGMEHDDEVAGGGNSYTTFFRQYDPRIARWKSMDPLTHAFQSPYNAFDGDPIYWSDPSGADSEGVDPTVVLPDEAESGDLFISPYNFGELAPNGQMLSGSDGWLLSGNTVSMWYYQNIGKDRGGNDLWVVVGFEVGGEEYLWDTGKDWFANKAGTEFDDSWAFDLTNAVGGVVGPVVELYTAYLAGEDPFAQLKKEWSEYDGTLFSFMYDGLSDQIGDWVEDVSAGGHKGSQALLGAWVGFTSGGLGGATIKSLKFTLCFIEGTLIASEKGFTKIENIQIGDLVWSFDLDLGFHELQNVDEIFVTDSVLNLRKIHIGNEVVTTTNEHPFYLNGEWIEAKYLKIGDSLKFIDDKFSYVITENKRFDSLVTVYNFSVVKNNNYYVSQLGILVHNNCTPKIITQELKNVMNGNGTPRVHPNGTPKIFQANEFKNRKNGYGSQKKWMGAEEFKVEGPAGSHYRILKKINADGSVKYGYSTYIDYKVIHEITLGQ